ncbi:MAG: hypothetical protein JXB85_14140 [Anaerolineales bacterium]|nr:hypothetical protein [Anaerolineales bacterium]
MTGIQPRLDLSEEHARALAWLLDNVPPAELLWALTGSAGLRLQGVDLQVHDLDIQTDQQTVYAIEQRLGSKVHTPVRLWESPGMRSLDGKARVAGIEIELLANLVHRLPDGSWSSLTDFSRLVWLDWHGRSLAVFPLENEAEAYEAMGRAEKAALIRQTIRHLQTG